MPFPAVAPGMVEDQDNRLPKVLHRVEPTYPAGVKDRTVAAQVYVAFVVDNKGAVANPRALFGTFPEFEKAATDAVAQWQFSPGRHEGRFVKTRMTVLLHFVPGTK